MSAHGFRSITRSSIVLSTLVGLVLAAPAAAKDIKCGTPSKGGTIKIAVYGAKGDADDAKTGEISMTLSEDSLTADAKARLIARRINASYAGVYEATPVNGQGKAIVTKTVPGGEVKISINSDETGEKDLSTCSAGQNLYYYCQAPASGVSWDGFSTASISVGTSTHEATIPTSPGQSPLALLGLARANLIANGVTEVRLHTLPGGGAYLHIVAGPGDTDFVFGSNDTGHGYRALLTDTAEVPVPGASTAGLLALAGALAVAGGFIARRRSSPGSISTPATT